MRLLRQKLCSYRGAKRLMNAVRYIKNIKPSFNNFTYRVNQSLRNQVQPNHAIAMSPPIMKDPLITPQEAKNTARKAIIKVGEVVKNIQQIPYKISNKKVGETLTNGAEFVIRKPHVAAAIGAAQLTTPVGTALIAKGGLANYIIGAPLLLPGYGVGLPAAANKLKTTVLPEGLPRKVGGYISRTLNGAANKFHNLKVIKSIRNSPQTFEDCAATFGNIM